jgi:hypothetical protein
MALIKNLGNVKSFMKKRERYETGNHRGHRGEGIKSFLIYCY